MEINNDDTLRRTMIGKNYKVKGYIIIPFSKNVKALDEDEAEDIVYQYIEVEDGEFEKAKIETYEIIEEDN